MTEHTWRHVVRGRLFSGLAVVCVCLSAPPLLAQDPPATPPSQPSREAQPAPILRDLVVQGASVFTRDDVMWLLELQMGAPLAASAEALAVQLEKRYEKEGYAGVTVRGEFDRAAGRLTLHVAEPHIDDIQIVGVPAAMAERFRRDLEAHDVRAGAVYNQRVVHREVDRLLAALEGALTVGRSERDPQDEIDLVDRGGRHVLIIPLHREVVRFAVTSGTGDREDLFNPVDGFSPLIGFAGTAFDRSGFNHTFIAGFLSYKFGRDHIGYSLGVERPLLDRPRLFVGVEAHDITATDDLWRLTTAEQTLVSAGFKNTFRDYYRRKGLQAHAGVRPSSRQELLASWRWDTHEPLQNRTDFSLFRGDAIYRPNAIITGGDMHALVLAYTYDSRRLSDQIRSRYERHLVDDLFRGVPREDYGWRIDWTTELAGHGMGGDYEFDRHIVNARADVPIMPHQSIAARVIAGFSGGALPVERRFAVGGIGTVHGYSFKEVAGERMTLFNAEYRLDLVGGRRGGEPGSLRGLLFFDAGRVERPFDGARTDWLKGVGLGVQSGPIRLEFGFRADDIPRSRQILLRLSPTF